MDRKRFNECIAAGMRGKTFTKEERRLEFCTLAKVCSGKAKTREEALAVCSQPKPAKIGRRGRAKTQSCDKDMRKLASCMVEHIDMDLASNINSIETAMLNALIACACGGEDGGQ